MSLSSASFPQSHYIFACPGDLNGDPETTEVWYSFLEEEEDNDFTQKTRGKADLYGPTWDYPILKNTRNNNVTPNLRPEDPIRNYTTQDKIIQCQNGSYMINCLKARQNFSKGVNDFNRDFMKNLGKTYRKNEDGTIEMIDQEFIKRQKKVFGLLVKQFGATIFSGKSIASISVPVIIFQPVSGLEQEARYYVNAPHFLEAAGQSRDPVEQFKLTIAHHVSSLYVFLGPGKPFNPILGETFQGIIGGCPIYSEQISHHPPIAALEMIGKNFKTESVTEVAVNISLTQFKLSRVGLQKVIFKNTNTVIKAQLPQMWAHVGIGRRTVQFGGKLHVFDIENKLYAEIIFDYEDSIFGKAKYTQDHFSGAIWRINDAFIQKLKKLPKKRHELEEIKFKEKKHAVELIAKMEGMWMEYLKIGDKIYWSRQEHQPYKLQHFDHPLPSDSNFRLDVLNLREGNEDQAQEIKTVLEELQRKDKKGRDSHRKKAHK